MNAHHTPPAAGTTGHPPGGGADRASGLDAIARSHHAAALAALSPRAQARLAQARHPAPLAVSRHRPAWALPTVVAAVAVLAIAVQLRPEPMGGPAAPPVVAVASPDATSADPAAALDENPDFYLWLASADDVMPTTPEY